MSSVVNQEDPKQSPEFEAALRLSSIATRYVHQMDGLSEVFPQITTLLDEARQRSAEGMTQFVAKYGIKSQEQNRISIPNDRFRQYRVFHRSVAKSSHASNAIPKSLFVSLVSHYDAFLGDVIRTFLEARSELLCASEKSMLFSQVLELGSVDEVKKYFVDKEVESVLRDSHAAHFAWLEKRFGVKLTSGLDIWSKFIELTERRNLFVHCDGIVSEQYMANCEKVGFVLAQDVKKGSQLDVSKNYFESAYLILVEIAVKLIHVLWRKLLPETRAQADANFNEVTFNFIVDEKYDIAAKLLDFSNTHFKQFSNEMIRRYMVLNHAQALKWVGRDKDCKNILEKDDWSASIENLRLAERVLQDDFDAAVKLMKPCAAENSIGKDGFRSWPIFKKIRLHEAFQSEFYAIYGEPIFEIEIQENAVSQ